jgi:hypothetical protein
MKTPREILFARHQAAAPKLDAVRRSVVEGLNNEDAKTHSFLSSFVPWCLGCSNKIWWELIWPCRRIGTGLAAVWLLIFIVNFSQRDPVSSATGRPVHAQAVMMSWQVQQRWMNELLADRSATPPEADRPKSVPLKPRTENNEMMTA